MWLPDLTVLEGEPARTVDDVVATAEFIVQLDAVVEPGRRGRLGGQCQADQGGENRDQDRRAGEASRGVAARFGERSGLAVVGQVADDLGSRVNQEDREAHEHRVPHHRQDGAGHFGERGAALVGSTDLVAQGPDPEVRDHVGAEGQHQVQTRQGVADEQRGCDVLAG